MIREVQTVKDYGELVAASQEKPVFLFKHSTRCPISASRWQVLRQFADQEARADFYRVLVVESRPLSMYVADESGVRHQSPQAILFHKGQAVWDESHYRITETEMQAALERALTP